MSREILDSFPPEVNVKDVSRGDDIAFEIWGDGVTEDTVKKAAELLTQGSKQNIEEMIESFGDNVIEPILPIYSLSHLLLTNTWHSRCINLLAEVATQQGWFVTSEDDEQEAKEVEDYIKEATAPGYTDGIDDLLHNLLLDYKSMGDCYVEIVRDGSGKPVEFYHVPSLTVRLAKTGGDFPNGGFWQMSYLQRGGAVSAWDATITSNTLKNRHELFGGGIFKKVFFKKFGDTEIYDLEGKIRSGIPIEEQANEIIHIKRYHPLSPFYGIPDYVTSYDAMLGDESAEKWNLSFFENNRVPRWLFMITGGTFTEEKKEEFKTYFSNMLKNRPHLPTVISNPNPNMKITVQKLEADVNEASFLDYRRAARDEIIASHGTPPRMVGIIPPGQMGGKGDSQKQREDYKSFTVQPTQKKLTSWINNLILPEAGFKGYIFTLKSFDVEDSEEKNKKAESVTRLIDKGAITINEGREIMGLKPRKDSFANENLVISDDFIYSLATNELLSSLQVRRAIEAAEEEIDDGGGLVPDENLALGDASGPEDEKPAEKPAEKPEQKKEATTKNFIKSMLRRLQDVSRDNR